jgi:hypothetical protein
LIYSASREEERRTEEKVPTKSSTTIYRIDWMCFDPATGQSFGSSNDGQSSEHYGKKEYEEACKLAGIAPDTTFIDPHEANHAKRDIQEALGNNEKGICLSIIRVRKEK